MAEAIIEEEHSHDFLDMMRHSTAHIMAEAVLSLFPDAKIGIGPTIEHGFYYDFDLPRPLTPEDLGAIEQKMRERIAQDVPFTYEDVAKDAARKLFAGQPYKLEIIDAIADEKVRIYTQGSFTDLCRGPHVPSTGQVKSFKLLNVAGAYWRGDERRPMLQRIYGAAFESEAEMEEHLHRLEEAQRRDHRRLGRELELFLLDPLAPGQPFWLPKGMVLLRQLEKLLLGELERRGYQEISTPSLVKKGLWEQSGHWDYYRDNMFRAEVENEEYAFKPMNCPEATIVYRSRIRSYRDLPLRLAENQRLLRNERSGTLNGLLRVRQLSMDDAHIFCRPDQILSEISAVLEFGRFVYDIFSLQPRYYLSTRPEKAMGDPALWEQAERELAQALEAQHIPFQLKSGEGAFYGPKIDVEVADALGRAWQLNTIQLDFNLPERFDLEYIGEDGGPHRPVMVHRAIFGTYERFIAVLIEHYAGAFPVWLAPIQAVVIPIADRHLDYARQVAARLKAAEVRVQVDERSERMNYKIREAQVQKVPYMLIVGDREASESTLSLRLRDGQELRGQTVSQFIDTVQEAVASKL